MIELILALILGLLAGTITGLIPGIHINLIAVILITSLTITTGFEAITLAVFITAVAITHTFLDFIPSVFLGAPDDDTFLSVLPGHQMLKRGLAHEAIVLTLYGSLTAIIIILMFTPIFIYAIPYIFELSQLVLPFILIFASIYLVLREPAPLRAIIVFLLAGFLGFATLNLPVQQPLLPLLTGLFGASAIIISVKDKIQIPPQKITPIKNITLPKKEYYKAIIGSIAAAPLSSFLPGVGSGHAAVIGSELIQQSKKGFLVLLGAINTIVIGLSFITLFVIGRTRTGAAVAVNELLGTITLADLVTILITITLTGIIAFIFAVTISKFTAQTIHKINYTMLSLIILALLIIATLVFSNALGFIVLITATALGVFTILAGARRINLMGALLIPTILFYLI